MKSSSSKAPQSHSRVLTPSGEMDADEASKKGVRWSICMGVQLFCNLQQIMIKSRAYIISAIQSSGASSKVLFYLIVPDWQRCRKVICQSSNKKWNRNKHALTLSKTKFASYKCLKGKLKFNFFSKVLYFIVYKISVVFSVFARFSSVTPSHLFIFGLVVISISQVKVITLLAFI